MTNIVITICTKNNLVQTFGYDLKFYKDADARAIDITNDLTNAKKHFGDKVSIVSVASWNEDKENSSGLVYESIDEVIEVFKKVESGV